MQRVLRQGKMLIDVDVGIGEVDREHGIVVTHVRAEQQELHAVEQKLETREKARVGMKDAVGSAGRGADVAVAVEHGEAVAMLQRSARPRRRAGRRDVEGNFWNRIDEQSRRLYRRFRQCGTPNRWCCRWWSYVRRSDAACRPRRDQAVRSVAAATDTH